MSIKSDEHSKSNSKANNTGSSIIGAITSSITQLHTQMPDSILFGTIFLYLITHNLAFGVFGVFIMEVILSHKLLGWILTQISGPSSATSEACRVGFRHLRLKIERLNLHNPYPSYGIFSITAMGTYLALATSAFSSTLSQMGTNWEWRAYIAYIFIALTILLLIIVRSVACESLSEIGTAFVFALIAGLLFFTINRAIFGMESMNFLGLPFLVNKDDSGDALYICSTA
jgi:hypothetical protein